jgi:hypothetical protein
MALNFIGLGLVVANAVASPTRLPSEEQEIYQPSLRDQIVRGEQPPLFIGEHWPWAESIGCARISADYTSTFEAGLIVTLTALAPGFQDIQIPARDLYPAVSANGAAYGFIVHTQSPRVTPHPTRARLPRTERGGSSAVYFIHCKTNARKPDVKRVWGAWPRWPSAPIVVHGRRLKTVAISDPNGTGPTDGASRASSLAQSAYRWDLVNVSDDNARKLAENSGTAPAITPWRFQERAHWVLPSDQGAVAVVRSERPTAQMEFVRILRRGRVQVLENSANPLFARPGDEWCLRMVIPVTGERALQRGALLEHCSGETFATLNLFGILGPELSVQSSVGVPPEWFPNNDSHGGIEGPVWIILPYYNPDSLPMVAVDGDSLSFVALLDPDPYSPGLSIFPFKKGASVADMDLIDTSSRNHGRKPASVPIGHATLELLAEGDTLLVRQYGHEWAVSCGADGNFNICDVREITPPPTNP